jgi:arginase
MLVHIDLDVIGSEYGIANGFAAPGGLSPDQLLRTLEQIRARFDVVALDLASYDPSCDRDGRILDCARRVMEMFPGT